MKFEIHALHNQRGQIRGRSYTQISKISTVNEFVFTSENIFNFRKFK